MIGIKKVISVTVWILIICLWTVDCFSKHGIFITQGPVNTLQRVKLLELPFKMSSKSELYVTRHGTEGLIFVNNESCEFIVS